MDVARPQNGPRPAPAAAQYLAFALAGDRYALDIRHIREILELQPMTVVPSAPPWIRGVMNLRGTVVPVVALAVKLGLATAAGEPPAARPAIVVVDVELDDQPTALGLLVDGVDEVLTLSAEEMTPPPGFGTLLPADYLLGIARVGDDLAIVLDADRVLAPEELLTAAALAEAEAEAEAEGGEKGDAEATEDEGDAAG